LTLLVFIVAYILIMCLSRKFCQVFRAPSRKILPHNFSSGRFFSSVKCSNYGKISKGIVGNNVTLLRCYSDYRPPLRHIDTPDNNDDTIFDFSPEMYKKIMVILSKYPSVRKRSAINPLLDLAQRQCGGYIPLAAMKKIAEICTVPIMEVFQDLTFYVMHNRQKVGKFHIQVCVTTPCMLCGIDEITVALKKHLNLKMGETSKDGMFTLGEMECMGACVNAPMFVVSDYSNPPEYSYNYYEDVTVEKTIEIVEALRRGEKPPHGPQNGRKNAMGIQGKTTLFKEPPGPFCRDLDAADTTNTAGTNPPKT